MGGLPDIQQAIRRYAQNGLTPTPTALPGVAVVRTTQTTQPIGHVQEPTFTPVAGGAKQTALNGEVHRYGTGEYLVTTVDLPLVGQITAADYDQPFLAVAFQLNPERIAELLLDTSLPSGTTAIRSTSAFGVGHAPPQLLDAIARLLTLLDQPADIPALHAGIEREILWRLLTGPQGATIRQIGTADSRQVHLARAIRWIRDHYDEKLPIAALAATAAMSPSSFHRQFLSLTSMTPLEYQKQLRLSEARMRLLTGDHEVPRSGSPSATPAPRSSVANTAACSGPPPARPPSARPRPDGWSRPARVRSSDSIHAITPS